MSRVGKNIITIPPTVSVESIHGKVTVKGSMGQETYNLPTVISCVVENGTISLVPRNKEKTTVSLWGTSQRNLSNIVKGLSEGFSLTLNLVGVGYRASVSDGKIVLQLGYSHDIEFKLPTGVSARCEKPTEIVLNGPCKRVLGQVASEIRCYRKPEPYKGKGVIRSGEHVVRKEGKKK